jgi:hypothetical protein
LSFKVFQELLRETNLFLTQIADGVLGLSPKEHRFSNFISHLRNNSFISKNLFGLCLSANSGLLTLGGYNKSIHLEDQKIGFTNYKSDNLYKIELKKLTFADQKIDAKIFGGLDTGSTTTYFPKEMFDEFYVKLKEHCSSPFVCYGDILTINEEICLIKKKEVTLQKLYKSMPIFEFKFNEFTVKWEPKSYLNDNNKEEYCLGIHKWE